MSPDDRRLRVIRATYLALCGVTILAGLFICSGCEEPPPAVKRAAAPTPLPTPLGCPTSWWDDTRGCVEAGPPGRVTVPECCGRAKRTVR